MFLQADVRQVHPPLRHKAMIGTWTPCSTLHQHKLQALQLLSIALILHGRFRLLTCPGFGRLRGATLDIDYVKEPAGSLYCHHGIENAIAPVGAILLHASTTLVATIPMSPTRLHVAIVSLQNADREAFVCRSPCSPYGPGLGLSFSGCCRALRLRTLRARKQKLRLHALQYLLLVDHIDHNE